jgi:hypothetical protein
MSKSLSRLLLLVHYRLRAVPRDVSIHTTDEARTFATSLASSATSETTSISATSEATTVAEHRPIEPTVGTSRATESTGHITMTVATTTSVPSSRHVIGKHRSHLPHALSHDIRPVDLSNQRLLANHARHLVHQRPFTSDDQLLPTLELLWNE